VKGNDELTSLASSFNLAAERLQGLVESQRRVLASASHELRSPLARLRMALELLEESPEKRQERVKDAIAEVEELDALVEELMLAGRLELQNAARSDESVDIGELLSEEAARIGASAVTCVAPLHADPRLIRVLLRNLLENAVRHGLGAAVEAGVEPIPGDPAGVRIWVADRGPGIPEAERERIFEPFYRSRRHAETRDGGVGLGLYLVRKVARWYGGTVTIHSREGSGVRFEVVLREPAG
jgi:signal transduction histidine kinase